MKAFIVDKWLKGPEELSIKNVDLPSEPKKGELQIQVKAAGLNFFDTLMVTRQKLNKFISSKKSLIETIDSRKVSN
jgi:NADPH:quinone reductase-like Zn-dependent oxidoreductase